MHAFIDVNASRTFPIKVYSGAEISPAAFDNYVEAEDRSWVSEKMRNIRVKGCIIGWADLVDTTIHSKLINVWPLGGEESKPSQYWNGRWLNKMCRDIPFSMDSVAKVTETACEGAHQTALDPSSGFHHVSLDANPCYSLVFVGTENVLCGLPCV